MINFTAIEERRELLTRQFLAAEPFEHIVIDDFADAARLLRTIPTLPVPGRDPVNKSRDYIFARNKFEKGDFKKFSPECRELYDDFTSERFQLLLAGITGQEVFVDSEFFGGGIHLGGRNSFLDMHVDFNYHPLHRNWRRNLNILLYLNQGWKKEFGGELKLKHRVTERAAEVEPRFNRCVIMFTRDYTLHGYSSINFPEGEFRRSIAAYAYSLDPNPGKERSTRWMPEGSSRFKKAMGNAWPSLVKLKSYFLSSRTAKNK
ncbi:MAG: 2OG-Fe(II) oxygenase [Acidobacteriia bacterium]|nr:2OG-Fe(II) oxygenase [Terriglobia bacterium]